jgi:hypothetical protein
MFINCKIAAIQINIADIRRELEGEWMISLFIG